MNEKAISLSKNRSGNQQSETALNIYEYLLESDHIPFNIEIKEKKL